MFELDDYLRQAGAQRVDERASRKLGQLLEDNGVALVHKARLLARYAGRKEILRNDVLLAAKMLGKDSGW